MRVLNLAVGFVLCAFANAQNSAAIQQALDSLSESVHVIVPDMLTKKAQHNDNDQTIGQDLNQTISVFNAAASQLAASSASAKVKRQTLTTDDLSTIQGQILSDITQGLNGVDKTDVPSFTSRIPDIDTAISGELDAFFTAIGGNKTVVTSLSTELNRIWVALGMTKTSTAAGF